MYTVVQSINQSIKQIFVYW